MGSLTAHFLHADAHGELPFHPGCPVCRETRLVGTLAAGGVLSPRTQAVLAAGVLVISSTAPATSALAAEPDQQQDGTAPITQDATSNPDLNPDFDPGGDSTDLPDTAPPLPETSAPIDVGTDDTAPVEEDPTTDPSDPIVDAGDGSGQADAPSPPDSGARSTPPTSDATPPPANATTPPNEPAPSPVVPTGPTPTPTSTAEPTQPPATSSPSPAPSRDAGHPTRIKAEDEGHAPQLVRRHVARGVSAPSPASRSVQEAPAAQAEPAAPGSAVAATPTVAPTTGGAGSSTVIRTHAVATVARPAGPGDRVHTVEPGESLWTIAADVLGHDASPARVAREVHRLWILNRDRIGTGDPDLLLVGTRLVLQ